ncbi:MAG: MGMT family protein [Dehalococcoidales bacterium]|nr:MGMT family protein [Dehalococcoidales bacterium]
MPQIYYAIFKIKESWMGLSGSLTGLSRTTLPCSNENQAAALLAAAFPDGDRQGCICDAAFFAPLIEKFQAYFQGCRIDFTEKIDPPGATLFRRKVWEATRLIPYGETRSYGWIANRIGQPQSSRAVGQALKVNPLPLVVPCHRVIASGGSLCGFAGGVETKQQLIKMEMENTLKQRRD